MSGWLSDRLRLWVLGSAATGLLMPSTAVLGQTKSAATSSKKKPAVAQVVEPPQLLRVPDKSGSKDAIRPVAQMEVAAAEKSAVQRELESLYEQDGREMPQLNLQPLSPLQGAPNQPSDATSSPATAGPALNPANQAKQPAQPKAVTTQRPTASGTMPWNVRNQIQYTTQAENQKLNPATEYPAQTQYPVQAQPQVQMQTQPHAQRYTNLFTDDQAANQQQKPQTSRPGFLRRLLGSSNAQKAASSQAPVPPDFRDISAIPTTPLTSPGTAPAYVPPANGNMNLGMQDTKYYTPANQKAPPAPVNQPATNPVANRIPTPWPKSSTAPAATNNAALEAQQSAVSLPTLYQQPLPVLITAPQAPMMLPQLLTEAQTPLFLGTSSKSAAPVMNTVVANSGNTVAAAANVPVDLPSPSLGSSDVLGNNRYFRYLKRREIAINAYIEDANPKATVAKQAKPESAPEATAMVDEDPFAVGASDFAEPITRSKSAAPLSDDDFMPPVKSKNADLATTQADKSSTDDGIFRAPAVDDGNSRLLVAPPLDGPIPSDEVNRDGIAGGDPKEGIIPPIGEDEQHLEKMRKIRERFGMKGLKGFCPVTLHDERELIDAKAEYSAVHRSQKFHFASAEARDKFEADPVKYAPAAYGADVVALFSDRDVVEGTLDHAAWFKGRLYLFGTQENYEIFIDNPAKFATLSGIE